MAAMLALAMLLAAAWVILCPDLGGGLQRLSQADAGPPTIVVDAGHGGHDGGATGNGLREKDLTLDTALRLEKKLRALGFPVVLTRRDDRYLELGERSKIANKYPHALFVSIHFNAFAAATGEGVETYFASDKVTGDGWRLADLFRAAPEPQPLDDDMALAQTVQAAVVAALGVTDRGVKPAGYAVIRHTRCPAVLIEGGFINNPAQAKAIGRPAYRETLATAIAGAVSAYRQQRAPEAKRPALAQAGR